MARRPDDPDPPAPSPLELGRAAASQLAGEWQLDAEAPGEAGREPGEPGDVSPGEPGTPGEPGHVPTRETAERPSAGGATTGSPPEVSRRDTRSPTGDPVGDGLGVRSSGGLTSPGSPGSPVPHAEVRAPHAAEVPPSPEQIVEAMLFVGGPPLTAAVACSAVRGLTPDGFQEAVDALNRRYRRQNRPYAVQPRDGGFALAVLPAYRGLRERLFGGPREARLSQPALDVLAVVAYRQPVGKAEVDAVRGTDSGGVLRQLVRLGLVAVRHRAESGGREVRYGTTPRFLQVFGLTSLDELPRLGPTESVG